MATSLAGRNRSGTFRDRPTIPHGPPDPSPAELATCSGVLPPSEACGSSAAPSGITITYFAVVGICTAEHVPVRVKDFRTHVLESVRPDRERSPRLEWNITKKVLP